MNNKTWFEELTRDRKESAKTFEKESMKGALDVISNKNSEKAHFIYELIQNADDVNATEVKFVLNESELIFSHNGTERFTISKPSTAEIDKSNGVLGHINAITSLANSTKTNSEQIGKFGLGFKSVFNYTDTPYIYEADCQFKIINFFVPVEITNKRKVKTNTTEFKFPFNKSTLKPQVAYKEILNKLKTLSETLLFLNNVKKISWKSIRDTGQQTIKINTSTKYNSIQVDYITSKIAVNKDVETKQYYKFSKQVARKKQLFDCIVFSYDKKSKTIIPTVSNAYCFFETKHETNLKFIINAPFELTDNRERLLYSGEKDDWNLKRLNSLAKLTTEAISLLSTKIKEVKIDHSILDITPLTPVIQNTGTLPFSMFYTEILNGFKTNKILNTEAGENVDVNSGYWTEDRELVKLFPDKLLSELLKKDSACFIFPKLLQVKDVDSNKLRYLKRVTGGTIIAIDLFKKITGKFIERRKDEWLIQLYKYINKKHLSVETEMLPIYLNQSGKVKARLDSKGNIQLFIPESNSNKTTSIHERFVQSQADIKLFEKLNFKKPNLFDEVINKVIPYYNKDEIPGKTKLSTDFRKIYECYLNSDTAKRKTLIDKLSNLSFLLIENSKDGKLKKPTEIHIRSIELENYFNPKIDVKYLDFNTYIKITSTTELEELNKFFKRIKVNYLPLLIDRVIPKPGKIITKRLGLQKPNKISKRGLQHYIDKEILGAKEILKEIKENHSKEKSNLLWNILLKFLDEEYKSDFIHDIRAKHIYEYRKQQKSNYFTSQIIYDLITSEWLRTHEGLWVCPKGLSISELDGFYNINPKSESTIRVRELLHLEGVDLDKVDHRKILEQETNQTVLLCNSPEETKAMLEYQSKLRATKDEVEFVPWNGGNKHKTPRSEAYEFNSKNKKAKGISSGKVKTSKNITAHKRNYKYLLQLAEFGLQKVHHDLNDEFSSKNHQVLRIEELKSKQNGYNFEVRLDGEVIRYVKVKTTEADKFDKIKLSGEEWEFAKELHHKGQGNKLYIYIVVSANSKNESIKSFKNPYTLFEQGLLKTHKVELKVNSSNS